GPALIPQIPKSVSPETLELMRSGKNGIFTREDGDYLLAPQYFEERRTLDLKDKINKVDCPVLIIHGIKDEHQPIAESIRAAEIMPRGTLEAIADAHHFSTKNLADIVIPHTVSFLKKYLH
ncbi:MAG: alpha/beta hydrolase, partial [Candidatus Woesearchaeota archaeon]